MRKSGANLIFCIMALFLACIFLGQPGVIPDPQDGKTVVNKSIIAYRIIGGTYAFMTIALFIRSLVRGNNGH